MHVRCAACNVHQKYFIATHPNTILVGSLWHSLARHKLYVPLWDVSKDMHHTRTASPFYCSFSFRRMHRTNVEKRSQNKRIDFVSFNRFIFDSKWQSHTRARASTTASVNTDGMWVIGRNVKAERNDKKTDKFNDAVLCSAILVFCVSMLSSQTRIRRFLDCILCVLQVWVTTFIYHENARELISTAYNNNAINWN